ncbi:MAG: hypothetical protein ABSC26_09240 [Stellaceae bacterium]|jgi:hypothetical protein
MTTVVATHAVGNMNTWLGGGNTRKALFAKFSSNYRILKHASADRVSIVFENADLDKMKALLGSAEAKAAKAKDTVIDPIDIYIEVVGGK